MAKEKETEPVVIKFEKNFYSLNAVKNGVLAYKDLAGFAVKNKKRFIEVTAKDIDENCFNVFADEFCNYVLAEMRNAD